MIFTPLFGWFGWAFLVLVLVALCVVPLVTGAGPRWRWFARIGVVGLLALALARPGIPVKSSTQEYEAAADVYFVVDTTASMAAEDFDGAETRLDGVKQDMLDLADELPGTRVSVISFAATAATTLPLTTDHAAFASAVDVLSPEMSMNSNGSSITEAGGELDQRLRSNKEDRPDNKVFVYYFGDGEQTVNTPPESWASFADRIDGGGVFGYGTKQGGKMREAKPFGYGGQWGEPEQQDETDWIRDANGKPGRSVIDEGNLKSLASDLGVDYHHRTGTPAITSVVDAPSFEQNVVKKDGRVTVDEYFWVPLILVFVWLAVEMIFGVRELGRLRSFSPRRGGSDDFAAVSGRTPQRSGTPPGGISGAAWGNPTTGATGGVSAAPTAGVSSAASVGAPSTPTAGAQGPDGQGHWPQTERNRS